MNPARDWTTLAIAVLSVVALAAAAAFMAFGVGADLSEWREVRMVVIVPSAHPELADTVRVGDSVFSDPAAMYVGEITEVSVGPMMRANPDYSGVMRVSEDPLTREITLVISTRGRESAEVIAIGSQVVQVGMPFTVVSREYQLRGRIAKIDVR